MRHSEPNSLTSARSAILKKRVFWVGLVGGFIFGFLSLLLFLPDHVGWQTNAPKYVKIKKKTMKLLPIRYQDISHWQRDDHLAALKAFRFSCENYLAKSNNRTSVNYKRLAICKRAMRANLTHKHTAKAFFEQNFQPHRVLTNSSLLTGYYEPELEGSRQQTSEYIIPVYRKPPDLVSLINDRERAAKNHRLTFMRRNGKGLEPFPTREAIEQGALKGQGLELIYLKDQVDAFFMHIQGSARIRLTDGSVIRIGYDGKNGHPYRSIGKHLQKQYKFKGHQLRLEAVKQWLRDNKTQGQKVMWHNKSYIFFRELSKTLGQNGPIGAEGVSLTPRRSLAVDGSYHQLGMPIWLDVPNLTHHGDQGFHQLMIGQDVGSAIKGSARGDIYWGSGEAAGVVAGGTKHKGRFTILLPR